MYKHEMAQMYYSVGMKGVRPENFQTMRDLVTDTLKRIVKNDFEPD